MVFEYQDDETKIIEVTEEVENTRKPGTPPPDAPEDRGRYKSMDSGCNYECCLTRSFLL